MITPDPCSIIEGSNPRSSRKAGNGFSSVGCCQSSVRDGDEPAAGRVPITDARLDSVGRFSGKEGTASRPRVAESKQNFCTVHSRTI
jgi:hypothetical protein